MLEAAANIPGLLMKQSTITETTQNIAAAFSMWVGRHGYEMSPFKSLYTAVTAWMDLVTTHMHTLPGNLNSLCSRTPKTSL